MQLHRTAGRALAALREALAPRKLGASASAFIALALAANAHAEGTWQRVSPIPVVCQLPPLAGPVNGLYDGENAYLKPDLCRRIERTVAGRSGALAKASTAWLTLAHEIAHHHGFDHGEHTLGADCIGERNDRKLMLAAGVPAALARRIDAAVTWGCPHPPDGLCSVRREDFCDVPEIDASRVPTIGYVPRGQR